MEIGELDRQVQLLRPSTARDATTGETAVDYESAGEVWAKVENAGTREGQAAAQRYAEVDLVVTIRWREDLDVTWGVQYEGRAYEIVGVEEVGRRDGLRLIVTGRAERGAPDPAR